jgi:hypothetical protein
MQVWPGKTASAHRVRFTAQHGANTAQLQPASFRGFTYALAAGRWPLIVIRIELARGRCCGTAGRSTVDRSRLAAPRSASGRTRHDKMTKLSSSLTLYESVIFIFECFRVVM